MNRFTYNDMVFVLAESGGCWDLSYQTADGKTGLAGVGLFAGAAEADALAKAQRLARTAFPVGVRSVGPDVAHPNLIGDLKIVGPDVAHPNFIYWDKDSSSFAR